MNLSAWTASYLFTNLYNTSFFFSYTFISLKQSAQTDIRFSEIEIRAHYSASVLCSSSAAWSQFSSCLLYVRAAAAIVPSLYELTEKEQFNSFTAGFILWEEVESCSVNARSQGRGGERAQEKVWVFREWWVLWMFSGEQQELQLRDQSRQQGNSP